MFFTTEAERGPQRATEFHSDDEAPEPVGEARHVEVEQQSYLDPAHSQICQQLRFVRRLDCSHRLYLNDDLAVDDDIGPKPFVEHYAFVKDGYSNLPLKGQACLPQLIAQALFVYRFQQTSASIAMNFNRQANDPLRQLLSDKQSIQLRGSSWPSQSSVVNPSES
jgi:hypothetical protein